MIITPDCAEELIRRRQESPELDYKEIFDETTGAWMELAKDVYAMANYGGGHIVIGVKDGTFEPVGVEESFHIDSQTWADKLSKWSDGTPAITYLEHHSQVNGKRKKFPILYIHGAVSSLIIPKGDGNYETEYGETKTAFKNGITYTRSNTKTIRATGPEQSKLFLDLIKRTAEKTGSTGTPLEIISILNKKAESDRVEEKIWSNLYPVVELPDHIYAADTEYRKRPEIHSSIKDSIPFGQRIPAFILADKKIYSFSEFNKNNPLTSCIKSTQNSIFTDKWLFDKEKQRNLVMLLNYNLKDLCWARDFQRDRHGKYFIKYHGKIPNFTWRANKRRSTRMMINIHKNKDGKLMYYEHFGARMRFIILGSGVYLVIEPTRVLTKDGQLPLDQRWNTSYRTRNNTLYHNNNYLYDTKVMLQILAGKHNELQLGSNQSKIVVSITPLSSKVNFGIIDDRYTDDDFLDKLQFEPLEYEISYGEVKEENPLTVTSLED